MSTISNSTSQANKPLSRDVTPDSEHIEAAKILMIMSRSYYDDLTGGQDSSPDSNTLSPGSNTTDLSSPLVPGSSSGSSTFNNDIPSTTDTLGFGSSTIADDDYFNSSDDSSIKEASPSKTSLPFLSRNNGRYVSTLTFAHSFPANDVESDQKVESSIIAIPDTTIEATEKAEVEAEILMHNQRVQDFLTAKANPDYTLAGKHQFIREWPKSFCFKRLAEGHPKLFTCASNLINGQACTTGQEYGAFSLSRPCIATFFGHNKIEWLQVPTKYRIVLCRKHYQTGAYKGLKHHRPGDPQSYQSLQVELLRAQIRKIVEWRPDATFTVQPNAAMQKRIASYHKLVSRGSTRADAAREVDAMRKRTSSRDSKPEEKTSVEFALQFDGTYGKHGVNSTGMLDISDFLEEQLKSGGLQYLPAVEFLLDVRPEDRTREFNSRRLRLEREKEKMALPEELKPTKRLVRVKQEKLEGDEDVKTRTFHVVKRKRVDLEAAMESKKGKN